MVARATVSAYSPPIGVVAEPPVSSEPGAPSAPEDREPASPAPEDREPPSPARRSALHVARRQRRRDALVGLSVLAAALGTTVAVLDTFH